MTCIVAFKVVNGDIVLAGDKAGSDGWTKNVYVRPKVFQNGEFFIGYCGSFYAGQLLEHVWIPPVKSMHITDDEYLFRDVPKSLSKLFVENDFGIKKHEKYLEPNFATFILVYRGRIFTVQQNNSLLETNHVASVGSGADVMLGAYDGCVLRREDAEELDLSIKDILDKCFYIVSNRTCFVSENYDALIISNTGRLIEARYCNMR